MRIVCCLLEGLISGGRGITWGGGEGQACGAEARAETARGETLPLWHVSLWNSRSGPLVVHFWACTDLRDHHGASSRWLPYCLPPARLSLLSSLVSLPWRVTADQSSSVVTSWINLPTNLAVLRISKAIMQEPGQGLSRLRRWGKIQEVGWHLPILSVPQHLLLLLFISLNEGRTEWFSQRNLSL